MSGRPDPSWPLAVDARDRMLALWRSLSEASIRPPRPPSLGYRGCKVAAAGETWVAFAGVVQHRRGNAMESRGDPDRAMEHMLVRTAPDPALRDALERLIT